MLKLDRLELSGFKSFVDPVEVRFAGGITGIVGPNGCGKSNLSDAITWVLGEQSAKSLRGASMEDVIFAGSESRKPLGMGEATVTFTAPPGFEGSEDGKITIGRRVFRTGESQYRLNGKVTRLKDIKSLLMDTGLGVRAYSVIEQGKIGMILSGKPQERRRLLEEAAGITRYKERKRIAEVKLEEAASNLLRLDDILSEVERNLRSLKRQAGAARRYQERQAERRELERVVLSGRWSALACELAEAREELAEARAAESEAAATVHRSEAELAEAREEVERRAELLAATNRAQAELAARIEGRQEFLTGGRRTLGEIAARVSSGEALVERLRARTTEHEAAFAEIEDQRARLVADHDQAAQEVAADGEALRLAEGAVRDVEAELEERRRELLASLGQLNELRDRLHREQIEREKCTLRARHLADQLERRSAEIAETTAELDGTNERLTSLGERMTERVDDLRAARSELERVLAEEQAATRRLRDAEDERTAAQERRRLLLDLAAAEEDREAAFAGRLAAVGLGDARRLRESIAAWKGWEHALDHFLEPWIDAVLVPEGSDFSALASVIAGDAEASGVLLRAPGEGSEAAPALSGSGIVAPLAEALGLGARWRRVLPPAYLADDLAAATRLAEAHPGVAFLSPDAGWAQAGLVRFAGANVRQPGFLARTSELETLAGRLEELETALATTRAEIAGRVEARARIAEGIRRLESEISSLRQEEAVARSRRAELSATGDRLAQADARQREEHASLAQELERLARSHGDVGADLERVSALHAEREARFDELQGTATERRQHRESLRETGAGRRGHLDVLAERLSSLEQQAGRHRREIESAALQTRSWEEESAELANRRGELETEIARAEEELQQALEARAGGESTVTGQAEAVESSRESVRGLDKALTERRLVHDQTRERIEGARVRLAGLEHDETHLKGEILERTGGEPPEPGEIPQDLETKVGELAELLRRIEAMGPVNVLAAEEYESEEERHVFLSTQREDVARSVESLRQTIKEINHTSSERFRAAFTAVNEQFAKTFVELFRGGEAEMRLLDEEDVLESGIEIVARPPGKRLQNLMLLSGGEKALTAIALLFALFRIKPSPFCILDEVDAPLDDVNTLRFVAMLRELAKETQCIVITHNKLTMEVASSLYGVTMEERGVSKLIQVELEEVHPEIATA